MILKLHLLASISFYWCIHKLIDKSISFVSAFRTEHLWLLTNIVVVFVNVRGWIKVGVRASLMASIVAPYNEQGHVRVLNGAFWRIRKFWPVFAFDFSTLHVVSSYFWTQVLASVTSCFLVLQFELVKANSCFLRAITRITNYSVDVDFCVRATHGRNKLAVVGFGSSLIWVSAEGRKFRHIVIIRFAVQVSPL